MKNLLIFNFLIICNLMSSQIINIGSLIKKNGTDSFQTAFERIKESHKQSKKHITIIVPPGMYVLEKPIILNKYISLIGESEGSVFLKVENENQEAIILEDNKNENDIYSGYNTIKNLVIIGPDYGKNGFAWKNTELKKSKSVGIKILGLRNRIENCIIDGFLWSGIQISSSYYNFITKNFIKNNRIGVLIENTSTSSYINNNEIRVNGNGIVIQNNSYANFINNNMIENNTNNMMDLPKNSDDPNINANGNGILIRNSFNNFIQNNYFEQHYSNIFLSNATHNEISSNFFGVNENTKLQQNIIKISGNSQNNNFIKNQTMGAKEYLDTTATIIIGEEDFSSNIIDFGREKNIQLKKKIKAKKQNFLPEIPE